MPGQPAFAHWGMDDPSEADDASKKRAYDETFTYLSRRIDLLLALPFETLEARALELRAQHIADEVPVPAPHAHLVKANSCIEDVSVGPSGTVTADNWRRLNC